MAILVRRFLSPVLAKLKQDLDWYKSKLGSGEYSEDKLEFGIALLEFKLAIVEAFMGNEVKNE